MTKKFKNSFGVTGSPAQIEAFKEWAQGIGWKYQPNIPECLESPYLFFKHTEAYNEYHLQANCFWHYIPPITKNVYHLPAQWSEAMKAAEEVVEESVYKTGNKVRNRFDTIVHCSGKETGEHFYGQIISTKGHGRMGLYRKWSKLDFTLHTDPVTI